MEKFLLLTS